MNNMTAIEIKMFRLLKRLNYVFYVDGTAKAMRPLMVETKGLLNEVREEYGIETGADMRDIDGNSTVEL